MGVLALDVRTNVCAVPSALCGRQHIGVTAVHCACYVAPLAVSFVVCNARGVECFDGFHYAFEVVAASTLVSCAPAKDANMVAEGADMSFVAFNHWLSECFYAGQTCVPVAFNIRFGKDIQSVLVA